MTKLLYPGTFDPFTLGHYSLVMRGLNFCDRLVIALGINEQKTPYFSLDQRLEQIAACFPDNKKIEITHYTGLTGDFAQDQSCTAILRGVRSLVDYEYEKNLADFNAKMFGLETLILYSRPEMSTIQSAMVRELLRHGKDVSAFVPPAILPLLKP